MRVGAGVLTAVAAVLTGCTSDWDAANNATADTRLARDTAIDASRHGPEIAAFAGVKTGDKIIDLIPGRGYWTRTFARIIGPTGHVYGIWPRPYVAADTSQVTRYATMIAAPAFANVSTSTQDATRLDVPEKVDLVFTAQNYHDYPDKFMGPGSPAALNKAVFAALKPGGVYLVIDHVAATGSGLRDTDTLHRIDPEIVKKQVTGAGFEFVGQSPLLANPEDDHSKPVFDPAVQGHTDQFIYKFRKP